MGSGVWIIMSEATWHAAPLKSICSVITDGSHFSPISSPSGFPYVTVRDISDGKVNLESSARVSQAAFDELERNGCRPLQGDVLFSKDGTVGKVALVESSEPFVVLSSLAILRPLLDVVVPAFLALSLQSQDFQTAAIGQKTGLAIKRVVLKHLREMQVPLPPLPVQRRIVDLMTHLDDHIANLRTELQGLKDLQSAQLKAFLNDLEPGEAVLGDVSVCSWGNTSLTKKAYTETGHQAYSASGPDGLISTAEMFGDAVILSAIGARCGGTWFASGSWTAIKNTIWIQSSDSRLSTKFLYWLTRDRDTFPKRGQAQPFISLGDVRSLQVSLPSREKQDKVVGVLDSIDANEKQIALELGSSLGLRETLLGLLLSGDIQVQPLNIDLETQVA